MSAHAGGNSRRSGTRTGLKVMSREPVVIDYTAGCATRRLDPLMFGRPGQSKTPADSQRSGHYGHAR